MLRWLLLPSKYRYVQKYFGKKAFTILDIGAGNHSASKTKKWFPQCSYHGLDLDKTYNNDEHDFNSMDAFYELNLEHLQFNQIPNNRFDFIMCAHVVEHLQRGDEVLVKMIDKLKPGGYMYVEFPGFRSTQLPSMYGTLNFYDDPTHVRIYSVAELMNLFLRNRMKVISGGTRKHIPTILLMPLKVVYNLIIYRKVMASLFWDFLGFAEYVIIQKPEHYSPPSQRHTVII
ncbi:MAG: methyltransferase domain-containing protein [Chitinophagales bacterium]|nr:methyltransferase domain-containing protein [Chitinophagales bacterium]